MEKLYSAEEAAQYLGISRRLLKYHVHESGALVGIKVGYSRVFTQVELDEFKAKRRGPGRPRQQAVQPGDDEG